MPAYVEVGNCLGTKLMSFYTGNVDKNIPSHHHSVIVLLEPSTGMPLVVSSSGIVEDTFTLANFLLCNLKWQNPDHADQRSIAAQDVAMMCILIFHCPKS